MTVLLALNFFEQVLDHDLRYAPSFEYKIGDTQNEMDFGIISTGMFREVETIFGESKSGASLKADERAKLKAFGEKTGSYICFCTLSEEFSDDDMGYFRELYEADVKIILLTKHLLEMDYFELLKYKNDKHLGRSRTTTLFPLPLRKSMRRGAAYLHPAFRGWLWWANRPAVDWPRPCCLASSQQEK